MTHDGHHACSNSTRRRGIILFGLANLVWLIFRTGTKPTRIAYPCQRAALTNSSLLLGALIPVLAAAVLKTERFLSRSWRALALLFLLTSAGVNIGLFLGSLRPAVAVDPYQEIQLNLPGKIAHDFPASDIYVVNGRRASPNFSELIDLMGLHGLLLYKSSASGENAGPSGLIADNDVVVVKINEQWPNRGGTNTDVLREIIQAVIDHPDGFTGEIVVADNGQGYGSMEWGASNAEDKSQCTQDVVDMFTPANNVSTYDWQPIRALEVSEYSEGDFADGYIVYDTPDPETGIYVTYPKFQTDFGTLVSFKHGIWNGTGYERRLKVINVPVLKTHHIYGVTASLKHYMGVQSEGWGGGLGNGHATVGGGSMGTLMVETNLPTLNIIDAVWVNANPPSSPMSGPETYYTWATRVNVLAASTDPVALDYWAARHVLKQTAELIGYTATETEAIDPDNTYPMASGFGYWLVLTENEISSNGYNVTSDQNHMNVYVDTRYTHDVAVSEVVYSETIALPGEIIAVNTTVENQGDFPETLNVTAFYNASPIGSEEISVSIDSSETVTITWNTTGVPIGNYTLTIVASTLPDETDIEDNTWTGDVVTIRPPEHDIAVSDVQPFKTIVGRGYPSPFNITVDNQDLPKTFNVTIHANSSMIGRIQVELDSGENRTITFTWNTTGFETGNYSIDVQAGPVPEENDTTNNAFSYSPVLVTLPGDVDGDGDIDLFDAVRLLVKYGARRDDPGYDSILDINENGRIFLFDAVILLTNYGRSQ